jgi:large subunit ribosomal protein L32e
MKMVERLLNVRKQVKKRKPTYRRQQNKQFAKFKKDSAWRRPKGYQSKMRLGRRGHRAMPEVGYGSPKEVRGLNKNGLKEVVISNVVELKAVDTKTQIAVISKTVGGRKKLDILNEAKKAKMDIGNVKDIDKAIESLTKVPKKKETKKASAEKVDETKEAPKKEKKEVSKK